jgi:hypothetical protein
LLIFWVFGQTIDKTVHFLTYMSLPRVVDDFMENHCWAGLVPEMELPPEVDTILRATAVRSQAGSVQSQTYEKNCMKFVPLPGER